MTTKVKISFDLGGNDDKIEILTIDPMFAAVMYEIKFWFGDLKNPIGSGKVQEVWEGGSFCTWVEFDKMASSLQLTRDFLIGLRDSQLAVKN